VTTYSNGKYGKTSAHGDARPKEDQRRENKTVSKKDENELFL